MKKEPVETKGVMKSTPLRPADYAAFLTDLKARIQSARISASRAVNRELILLYLDIGRAIVEKQQQLGWGESVIDRLSLDLQKAFSGMSGFSPRNLRSMKQVYSAYTNPSLWLQPVARLNKHFVESQDAIRLQPVAKMDDKGKRIEFVKQIVAVVPWGQHLTILNKVTDHAARLYYLRATARFGWSRKVLLNQIKADAYERTLAEGKVSRELMQISETVSRKSAVSRSPFTLSWSHYVLLPGIREECVQVEALLR